MTLLTIGRIRFYVYIENTYIKLLGFEWIRKFGAKANIVNVVFHVAWSKIGKDTCRECGVCIYVPLDSVPDGCEFHEFYVCDKCKAISELNKLQNELNRIREYIK